jgi:ADP-ribose pyrophosphatase YjhB (NUDIX family)
MRLRIIRLGYRIAWLALWLIAPLHHGRGRGVKAILTHEGELLLVQHTYGPRRWELPGGGLRRSESPLEGIRREVHEELAVELGDPRLIAYGCGSGRQWGRVVSVFAAEVPSAAVTPDRREIERAQWYRPDALPPRLGWQVAASVDALTRGGADAPVELSGSRRGTS